MAVRGIGLAVVTNPVAFVIPCHRVIQQNGKLGGYHWGETRKQAIHAWEAARYEVTVHRQELDAHNSEGMG